MGKDVILRVVAIAIDNAVMLGVGAGLAYRFHEAIAKVVGPVVAFVEEYGGKLYGLVRGAKKAAAPAGK